MGSSAIAIDPSTGERAGGGQPEIDPATGERLSTRPLGHPGPILTTVSAAEAQGEAERKQMEAAYAKQDKLEPIPSHVPEPSPFPIDDHIQQQVKDLPPQQEAETRNGWSSVLSKLAQPYQAVGYSAASSLNRGMAHFANTLDTVKNWLAETEGPLTKVPGFKPTKGGFAGDDFFEKVAKEYEANADYWKQRADKVGVSFWEELVGSAVGGAAPGITEFMLDVQSGLTIPAVVGQQRAEKRGARGVEPMIDGLLEAAKVGTLQYLFRSVAPFKRYIQATALGTYFGAEAAVEAPPGKRMTEFAKGAGTGMLLGAVSPPGEVGIRDLYPEVASSPVKAPEQISLPPAPMGEGLRPAIKTAEGVTAGEPGETHPDILERIAQVSEPVSVKFDSEGNLVDADGRHRVIAALQRGDPTIPVETTLADGSVETLNIPPETVAKRIGVTPESLAETEEQQAQFKVERPEPERGFATPQGDFLTRPEAAQWAEQNEPDVHEVWQQRAGEGGEFHSEDYNLARETVEASRRPQPLGAASRLPFDNPGTFKPRVEPTGIWGAVGRVFHSMYKATTIDILPNLTDAGVPNNAVQTASADIATPRIVDNMLSRVFPDDYKNPAAMSKFIDILNKDNIMGGVDSFLIRASEARIDGDEATARKWDKLADEAKKVHDLRVYDAEVPKAMRTKKFMETNERWQTYVVAPLDQLYNEMKQVDAYTPRESRGRYLDSRINLLSEEHAARWVEATQDPDKPIPEPSASSYRNPNVKRDPTDFMATFTGQYSTDAKAVLTAVVQHRWREVTKLRFYNDLVENGVGIVAEGGQQPPEGYSRMPFRVPKTDRNGRTTMIEQPLFVPQNIVREIRGVLGTDMRLKENIVGKVLTNIQLAQLADLTTHTKNIVSVVTRAQGGEEAWQTAVRKIPGLGSVDAIGRLVKTTREVLQDTPEMRAELEHMARRGLVRPEFPSTGMQKITRGQQIIHEADTAARVVMNRFFDDLVGRKLALDTEKNRRDFVNQVGDYNTRLMGPMMKWAKESGIAPFIVAGRNFNRQGRWAITGNPGVEAASMNAAIQMRVTNLLGTAALFTLPMLLNHLTTGKLAGRSGTPIGAWDLGLDPDENGKHKVIDLLNWTGARRGMRSIGLDAFAQGLLNGDHMNDIAGNAFQDAGNTLIHPWNGPAIAFVEKAATGKQLDLRGKMEAEKVPEGGGLQYIENFRAALESQNPLVYSIVRPAFQELGLDQKLKPDYAQDVVTTLLKSPGQAVGARDITPPPTEMERLKRDVEIKRARMRKDLEYQMGIDRKAQKKRFTLLKRRAVED